MITLHDTVPKGFNMALYKGTRPGIAGLYNRLGRLLDHGPYSHCELIFNNGLSASASFIDKGVRIKKITYTSEKHWDFLPIPDVHEADSYAWFIKHKGKKYDIMGNIRFATNFANEDGDKWFCSEACLASLGIPEAYRYGPSGAASVLSWVYGTKIIVV